MPPYTYARIRAATSTSRRKDSGTRSASSPKKSLAFDERLTREAADIRDEMRQGFADTQAMIKFSHSELDRRITSLEDGRSAVEETVADLQARVERLEGSTH